MRKDSKCVESNIHEPSDSSLLWDAVRALTRLIVRSRVEFVLKVPGFCNHTRHAKRHMLAVMNAKNKKQRKAAYTDLVKMAANELGYARVTLESIKISTADPKLFALIEEIFCCYRCRKKQPQITK